MLLRIIFFQQHKRKWRYIFAAPSDAITRMTARGDIGASVDARQPLELLSILVRQNRNCPGITVRARPSTTGAWATELLPCECVMRPIAWLCVAPMEFGFDPLLSRSEPRSCFFMPVSAPRSTMPSRCSMPPQPDQLRCRHDRHDNGERATPLAVPATQRNQVEILQWISRARARGCAQGGVRSESLNDGSSSDPDDSSNKLPLTFARLSADTKRPRAGPC